MNRLIRLGWLGAALALQACGGGGSGAASPEPPPPPPPPPASVKAGGVWLGTYTATEAGTSEDALAMIAEDGRFRVVMLNSDRTLVGDFGITTTPFEGSGTFYVGWPQTSSDDVGLMDVTFWGRVSERQKSIITWSSDWDIVDRVGRIEFDYDASNYERPSSLDDLAGAWVGFDDLDEPWIALDIDPSGTFVAQDVSRCDASGRFGVIDADFNLYEVRDVTFDCKPGSVFAGLAYVYDDEDTSDPALFLTIDDGTEALRLSAERDFLDRN